MPEELYLDQDSLKVRLPGDDELVTLFWGDPVQVVQRDESQITIELDRRIKGEWVTRQAVIPARTRLREDCVVLKVRFVDVGQGDGAIFETPRGRLVMIDGGERTNLVRYTSVLLHHLRKKHGDPVPLEAVIVTHGDADHFAGLTTMLGSRGHGGKPRFIPKAVFHNGLVKRPAKDQPEEEMFGANASAGGFLYCTELVDDLVACDPAIMNKPFREWREVLDKLRKVGDFPIERLWYGRNEAFDFLADEGEQLKIDVLGPVVDTIDGKPALRVLKKPGSKTSYSASHTINGHSIVIKLTFGNVRFLFGADLNEESEERLLEKVKEEGESLEAEVLKVPHHGSHEFIPGILEAIAPVVSIISSGDENASKEYIHPRSGLVGALGKFSRASIAKPLIFVTEMVAFFAENKDLYRKREPAEIGPGMDEYELVPDAYVKSQFGIVHVRTDGRRVLVFTHSGRRDMKEKYAFTVDDAGKVTFED